jgi:hypothetical protein
LNKQRTAEDIQMSTGKLASIQELLSDVSTRTTIGFDPVSDAGLKAQIRAAPGVELRGVPAEKGNSDVKRVQMTDSHWFWDSFRGDMTEEVSF